MKYSLIALTVCAGLAVIPAGTLVAAPMPDTSKMNLLFIIVEDWNAGTPGCYGNPICKTPNLDHFASSAVRFDSAYVQAVCCNPSRSSFLTGLRPLTSRVWSNGQEMDKALPSGTVTLPELLKRKGFHTAVVGKFFHTVEYAEKQLLTFDRIESYGKPPGWEGPGPVLTFPPVKRIRRDPAPEDKNSKAYREWRSRNSDRYGDSGLAPEEEGDYRNAQIACALLQEFAQTKEQFFLSVHQSRPHTPLIAPKKYIDLYDPAEIPDPPAPPEPEGSLYPRRVTGGNPDIFMRQPPTPQQVKEAIAAYYACVSFVDSNIGMILDELERQHLADNTIVFILGDHGFHLGDHGFWSKYSMLEATRRAPLWVRVPGAPANGRICREFVEFVDFVRSAAFGRNQTADEADAQPGILSLTTLHPLRGSVIAPFGLRGGDDSADQEGKALGYRGLQAGRQAFDTAGLSRRSDCGLGIRLA